MSSLIGRGSATGPLTDKGRAVGKERKTAPASLRIMSLVNGESSTEYNGV